MPSIAVEDYLKTIYSLTSGQAAASTSAIAERLGIAAGSVTGMLKRLSEQALVEHVPYYGARLTQQGEREAVRLIRRHRVLELFMVQVLGYTWDRVHDEAESLEHAATDELIDRMARVLGEPLSDPHGAPIPAGEGRFVESHYPTLGEMAVGTRGVLRRVEDEDPAALRYLAEMELVPGAEVELLERAPFNGPLKVQVAGREKFVGQELAKSLEVEAVAGAARRPKKSKTRPAAGANKHV
jgi:DtxR family transcriptional regulator, Mn-dependent transcriptional regulator